MTDQKNYVELFEFYNVDNLQSLELINFMSSRSTYLEKVELKINADKTFVFDKIYAAIKDITGYTPSFKFFGWTFYLSCNTVFVTVRYDMFGAKHKPAGHFSVSINAVNHEDALKLKHSLENSFVGMEINSVMWAISSPNESIIYKSMDVSSVDHKPKESFYPWLKSSLDDYYKAYLASEENILLLMGIPGTGKTTFIRDFLVRNKLNAVITYDERLMKNDNFFLDFLTGDDGDGSVAQNDVLIIEDADVLIEDREKTQNTILSKILNVSDGLVKNIDKKIIFSTNITDIDRIDSALIRPGRCYDVMDFRKLDFEEASKVISDVGRDTVLDPNRKYTLAELLTVNPREQYNNKFKIGFNAR